MILINDCQLMIEFGMNNHFMAVHLNKYLPLLFSLETFKERPTFKIYVSHIQHAYHSNWS